jgi:DNA replication and repair protein RecF
VLLRRLWLTDFRSYEQAEVTFDEGLTAIVGRNGEGKTNLLEAVGYLATLSSIRGAPTEALVRDGAPQAIVRAEGEREGRSLLLEAEINRAGRNRAMVNRQPLRRARDLLGALRVSVFSPDDLALVKGGPAERRRYLDDAMVAASPALDVVRTDLDRVLRQRNALLRQAGGRLTEDVAVTLDVWDDKLAATGDALARHRDELVRALGPVLADAYGRLAPGRGVASIDYRPAWAERGLAAALAEARRDEVRRGTSLVGPHRDEVDLAIDGRPSRTHASQGEQRTLSLALRLAAHDVVTRAAGSAPVLLLDDVFSELDPQRSAALVANLPAGQTLLTTASALPGGMVAGSVLEVADGRVRPHAGP